MTGPIQVVKCPIKKVGRKGDKMKKLITIASVLLLAAAVMAEEKSPAKTKPAGKASDKAAAKAAKVDLAAGKKVFETYCVACHGATGKGDGAAAAALNPKPRNFSDAAYMKTRTDEQLRKVVAEGGAANNMSPLMAGWSSTLKPNEIDNVVGYVRSLVAK
jgi:mono/diheme cytochrome c family protein